MDAFAEAFRTDLDQLLSTRLMRGEECVLAASVGQLDADYGFNRPLFGYWALTTRRLFRVWFNPTRSWLSNRPLVDARPDINSPFRKLVLPPQSPLDRDERASRSVKELSLERVVDVNWRAIECRSLPLFTVSIRALPNDEVNAVLFSERCAAEVHATIMRMISRRSHSEEAVTSNSVTSLIAALGKLHENGLLDDEEFSSKKQQLLERL